MELAHHPRPAYRKLCTSEGGVEGLACQHCSAQWAEYGTQVEIDNLLPCGQIAFWEAELAFCWVKAMRLHLGISWVEGLSVSQIVTDSVWAWHCTTCHMKLCGRSWLTSRWRMQACSSPRLCMYRPAHPGEVAGPGLGLL